MVLGPAAKPPEELAVPLEVGGFVVSLVAFNASPCASQAMLDQTNVKDQLPSTTRTRKAQDCTQHI